MNCTDPEPNLESFPSASSSLFTTVPLWGYRQATDNLDAWALYSEGYLRAAEQLYTSWAADPRTGSHLLFPLAFLYRHHIELLIKELLLLSSEQLKLPSDWKWHHNVFEYWKLLRPMMDQVQSGFSAEQLDVIEQILSELSKHDPRSQLFRYPIQTGSQCHLSQLDTLNLENFCLVARQLSSPLSLLCGFMNGVRRY